MLTTGEGVLVGGIDMSGKAKDSVIIDQKLISYSTADSLDEEPLDVIRTEFHILVLFASWFVTY